MRYLLLAIVLSLSFASAKAKATELVVIVHPNSGVENISREDAINIFMGRYGRLPSGIAALPIDLAPSKEAFYKSLVNRTLSEINSYWARLMFSGRASPPRQIEDSAELLKIVASNQGAIAYIPADQANDNVRVVLVLSGKS